jgi:PAS domain S-box-containing protein
MLYRIYGLDPERPFPSFDDQRGTLYPPESWDKLKAAVTEALRSGVGYEFDIPALRCGVPIHITARGSVIRDSAGQIVGLRGTVQDITERKLAEDALRESEERYRNLFTSIDEGFCIIEMIFDPHGKATDYRFSEYNQAFELHTGLKNAVGKTIRELVPNHDDFWFETYGKVAQTGEAVRFEHYAEAMSRWFNVYAFKMGEPAGRKVAVLFSNITARKDAEAALAAANARLAERADQLDVLVSERTARLQETVQELEVFSYSIAHDMRAPLRSMSGFADVLLADYAGELPPEGRELLTRIRRSALRLDQLTLDVLNYTKLGRQEMRVEPVDVKQLLAEILESYPHLTDAAPQIQLQPDYPIVLANRAALAQVFSNLLGNALKFTRKGIPAVVRVYSEGAADNRVRFTIQDNGIGIATKDLPRLFNIFQRVHSETSFEGTGIGLALVRKATQRMGGTFGVDSEPDRGSRFWVELKRAP